VFDQKRLGIAFNAAQEIQSCWVCGRSAALVMSLQVVEPHERLRLTVAREISGISGAPNS
jgi:hypothetical protein